MNRYRRLRRNPVIRDLVRETILTKNDFIQPFFVIEGKNKTEPIVSMPGINRYSTDQLLKAIEKYKKVGGKAGLLFGIPNKKDKIGSQAYSQNGVVQKALRAIKKEFPDFFVITDICLCAYTSHGHCGIIDKAAVDNDKTLPILGKTAISHAQAGADMVAPSDMMDFRVKQIRDDLDKNEFKDVGIMSYAVKYASSFYGPFRDAADSAPEFGDRKSYQMDSANVREALKEARADIQEGADLIMVKPALAYLDVILTLKYHLEIPIVAYSVSGKYSMIKAAAQRKWINERDIVLEALTSIKRSGADIIITYFAQEVLKWIK